MAGPCPNCKVHVPPGHRECVWCGTLLDEAAGEMLPDRVETFYDDHHSDGPSTLRHRNTDEMAALRPTEINMEPDDDDEEDAPPRRSFLVIALLFLLGIAGVGIGAALGAGILGGPSQVMADGNPQTQAMSQGQAGSR